jgi:dipeptidase
MNKHVQMAKLILTLALSSLPFSFYAQYPDPGKENPYYSENCTSIMVGRLATTDGSVITSHACDGIYRTWVDIFPHTRYEKGTTHTVYKGVLLPPESSGDMRNIRQTGEIPEAEETYAFLNTAYPCMNEKQLAIGETTITGRRELRNEAGIFYIEELEKIALQRCKTAREAITIIGKLAEDYGYGDWAECITIADPREVWQLEISGSGPGKPSAIWCAARIPDDHVGVSANIPRISTIDFNNPDFFMYSTDIRGVAKRLGYWDGKEPMKFWKIISSYPVAYDMREFFILSTLAPNLNLSFDSTTAELPFSVKPERKLSVSDIMKYFRETYEGTGYDMTKDLMITVRSGDDNGKISEMRFKSPVVSGWMSNNLKDLLNELKPGVVENRRPIAIDACAYSHVIQCRSWLPDEVGAIAWFSFDNPALSPRIPIFSGVTKLPPSFGICGQRRYTHDAALWSFRETNRLSTINWAYGRTLIEPAIKELENKVLQELPVIERKVSELVKAGKTEEAKNYITAYTCDFANSSIKRWEEMKAPLWIILGRGY